MGVWPEQYNRLPVRMACAYGPIAAGALSENKVVIFLLLKFVRQNYPRPAEQFLQMESICDFFWLISAAKRVKNA
jgi:hypothetical protein